MHRFVRIGFVIIVLLLGGALFGWWPAVQPSRLLAADNAATAAPDLVIESVTLSPSNPVTDTVGEISIKIKNVGNAPASGLFRVYLYINPTDTPPEQTTVHIQQWGYGLTLPAGQVFEVSRTAHVFTSANPKVYVWVDPPWENKVAEANEENNLYPDRYEADNDCSQAKAINADGPAQQHNLLPTPATDVDWVQLSGIGGTRYRAEALAQGDANLALEVHDNCTPAPPFGMGAVLTFTAPTDGVYYFKIANDLPDSSVTNSSYTFKITTVSNFSCTNVDDSDDICANAPELAFDTPQSQSFCKPTDVDWSRFSVSAGGIYKITTVNTGANANVQFNIHESCTAPAAIVSQNLTFTAPAAGFVYIETRNSNPNQYGAGAEYTLGVQKLKDGCVEDTLEQDDVLDTAKALIIDGAAPVRNICPAGDEDWAKFTATAGVTYTVETLPLGTVGDTVLCLYNGTGDQLTCDDDKGAGRSSRLVWQAPTNGDYFLSVRDHDQHVAGPDTLYSLQVSTKRCDQDSGEPDSSRNSARPINTDGTGYARNICPAGDEDWFTFTAAGSATYTLETTENGPEADTIISLYDSNGALLAENDDHAPGISSQLVYAISQGGAYYVKVRLYNPTQYGNGTEYQFRARVARPDPTPTPPAPTPTPVPSPTPTPHPSGVKTLILVNRAQIAKFSNAAAADQLMSKLNALAGHAAVQGQVIALDQNSAVRAAYEEWNKAENWANVRKANLVTEAIRQVIYNQVQEQKGIQFIVLVGNDWALPFRRIYDNTPDQSEKAYSSVDRTEPTGAALYANYFLSDDYYGALTLTNSNGRELYLPDLAVGRLLETPAAIQATIDGFLATNGVTPIKNVLITGYDFVQDQANADCADWRTDLGTTATINCKLISNDWQGADLQALQLRTTDPFSLQMIAGHANHSAEGAPNGNSLSAESIASSNVNWQGGLIYTPGCHAGLNVPVTNSTNPLDLTEAIVGRGANYVANTGYGWGDTAGINYSEKLVQFYTKELLAKGQSAMGTALVLAKQRYYHTTPAFSSYDEKVAQQFTFYGLPMQTLSTGAALSSEEEFAGVQSTIVSRPLSLGGIEVSNVNLDFTAAQHLELTHTTQGDYYALDGYTSAVPNAPIQPLYFEKVSSAKPAHGAVIISGTFTLEESFDAALAVPHNEYATAKLTPTVLAGWQPAIPVALQVHKQDAHLITQLSQYNQEANTLRRYQKLGIQLYYSDSDDHTAPQITIVDGLSTPSSGTVSVKIGAIDPSGIYEARVLYTDQATATSNSIKLTFDDKAYKWVGTFPGGNTSRFMMQVVDNAGNVAVDDNKGAWYEPAVNAASSAEAKLYLPLIRR